MKKAFILLAIAICAMSCDGMPNRPDNPDNPSHPGNSGNPADSVNTDNNEEEKTTAKYIVYEEAYYTYLAEDHADRYNSDYHYKGIIERDNNDLKCRLSASYYDNDKLMQKSVFVNEGLIEQEYHAIRNGEEIHPQELVYTTEYCDEARTMVKQTKGYDMRSDYKYDAQNLLVNVKTYHKDQLMDEQIYTYGPGVRYGKYVQYNDAEAIELNRDTCEYYDAEYTQMKTIRTWNNNPYTHEQILIINEYEYDTDGLSTNVTTIYLGGTREIDKFIRTYHWSDELNCTQTTAYYTSGNHVYTEKRIERYVK
jgi:hypothetical protein